MKAIQTWQDIKGKANLYKTARIRTTGEWVSILGLTRFVDGNELMEPAFRVKPVGGFWEVRTTEELCDFGL